MDGDEGQDPIEDGAEGQGPDGEGSPDSDGAGNPPGGGSGEGEGQQTFSLAYVKKLRAESARLRTSEQAAKAKLKALEDEKLSDAEKQANRLKELEAENRQLLKRARNADLQAAAKRAKASNPELVARLISDDVDTTDAEAVKAALKAVKDEYPEMFGAGAPGGSANGGSGGQSAAGGKSMNSFIRRAAGIQ